MTKEKYFDFIIVGQGLAGLAAAYYASQIGSVALVSKENIKISNSYLAQGGVAAAISKNDSPSLHFNDTIAVGKGLCNNKAVKILVDEGKEIINEIIRLGMKFDMNETELAVSLEGGHSQRRVLHANGIATGKELVKFFSALIAKAKSIKRFDNSFLHEIIVDKNQVHGVHLIDLRRQKSYQLLSGNLIIATGGFTGVYKRTTNPSSTAGEGITAAYNAGASVENIEFIQFHPTALHTVNLPTLLLSEALRGDGALIVDGKGKRVLESTSLSELSPRDELSKAIFNYLKLNNKKNVYLSLNKTDKRIIVEKYSFLYKSLKKFGIDITKTKIPISPAAHYSVGGIKTGLHAETNVKGLYSIGEAASSGVHGANRLASNSLLECLVFAKRAISHCKNRSRSKPTEIESVKPISFNKKNRINYITIRKRIGKLLWDNVGIVRSEEALKHSLVEMNRMNKNYSSIQNEFYNIQIQNLIKLASLIIRAALSREESRGCHYRSDYPNSKMKYRATSQQTKNLKLHYENN
ncbi:MAG: L-aspartate oxidase [Ignavibacteria bacterium]|nr:L-aspartate oxidase [Ignavibacteria bacterium]